MRCEHNRHHSILLTLLAQSSVDVLDSVVQFFDQTRSGSAPRARIKLSDEFAERAQALRGPARPAGRNPAGAERHRRQQGYLDRAAATGDATCYRHCGSCARCATACARGTSSCPPGKTLVLTEAGIEDTVTFEEETGTSRRLHPFQRPQFGELPAYARHGDTVHISEMFRLVQNTRHILEVLDVLRQGRLPHVCQWPLISGSSAISVKPVNPRGVFVVAGARSSRGRRSGV
ncbi:recombinase family protein (plasmid) [Embleya sp. NBC_00888]|nr:recombinase family protein [Embleya sp. NBC_00888]